MTASNRREWASAAMAPRRRQLMGRAGWTIMDQAVSSLTNAALSIVVARSVTASAFGAFAIAFTVYSLLIGVSRALCLLPVSIRFSRLEGREFRAVAQQASGAAVLLGVVTGLVLAIIGAGLGGATGRAVMAVAVVLPGLLLQDGWRLLFFAAGRPAAALVNDLVWAVAQLAGVWWLLSSDVLSAPPLVLAWGASAVIAAAWGVRQMGAAPRLRGAIRWGRAQLDLSGYLLTEFLTVMGAYQAALLMIAAIGQPADVGAIRAAQVVMGPLNILVSGFMAFALPELSRRVDVMSPARKRQTGVAVSIGMVLVVIAWSTIALLLPDRIGVMFLGDTWEMAQAVLPATVALTCALALALGPTSLLRAEGQTRASFHVNAAMAPAMLVGGVVGLELGGAVGAAVGFAAAQASVLPAWWVTLLRYLRRQDDARGDDPPRAGWPPRGLVEPLSPVHGHGGGDVESEEHATRRRRIRTVAVLPVGPDTVASETVESVFRYCGPDVTVVAVDDSGGRGPAIGLRDMGVDVVPRSPYTGPDGRLWFNLATAYRHVLEHYDPDVVLRIDTDALVIGPHPEVDALSRFAEDPELGMLGSYRLDYHGAAREFAVVARRLRWESGITGLRRPRRRAALRRALDRARPRGYEDGEHCLGGACFVSPELLRRLHEGGWLHRTELADSNLPEDAVFGLLTFAVGMRMADFGTGHLPLGVRWRGLPARPQELIARGKKVVHSVRFVDGLSEYEIREFFRARRLSRSGVSGRIELNGEFAANRRGHDEPGPRA